MEKNESKDLINPCILDFFCSDQWPNELRALVSQHLSPKDLLVCRLVCANWLGSTENEFYFKILERPYLSDYSGNLNGNYYRIFAAGGAHLIKTLEQLKANRVNASELQWMHYLNKVCVCISITSILLTVLTENSNFRSTWILAIVTLRQQKNFMAPKT
jgi:hypothetical protein